MAIWFRSSLRKFPTKDNDGLKEDGLSVVWKLKQGVKWHDGTPFTADDLIFNWEYAKNPETAAVSIGNYKEIKAVEKIDDHTVRVDFAEPTPFWADAFVGSLRHDHPETSVCRLCGQQIARMRRSISSRSAPAPICLSTSSPATPFRASAIPTIIRKAGRISTRSKSRAAATPSRPRARCCRPASTTTPGTCRSRTRSCRSWRTAARAGVTFAPTGNIEYIAAQRHRSQCRGRRRARQHQDQAPAVFGPRGARGHQPPDRSRLGPEVHLWPRRRRHRELPQQP